MRKTAIVTGASRGIGRTIALRLAADGFGVVVNYAGNAAKAEEVVNEITSSGGRGLAVQADVANPEDVKQLFEKTLKAFGQIDVVVNNAGIMPLSPIAKGDVETFDKVIATNLRGTFLVLSQAAQQRTGSAYFGRAFLLAPIGIVENLLMLGEEDDESTKLKRMQW
jgi:3-oxoacyl-[acyl-carrier protein] reductase